MSSQKKLYIQRKLFLKTKRMKNKSGKFLLSDKNAKTVMVICLVLLTAAFVFHAVQSHSQMSDIEWRLSSDIDDIKGEFRYRGSIADIERRLSDIEDDISSIERSLYRMR